MEKKDFNELHSYLTFKIGDEVFAANVGKVLSILEMQPITKVPKAPDYMLGVINLRGQVLPIVQTRIKFGMPTVENTAETCILVCDIKHHDDSIQVGAIVDSVQEVIEFNPSELLPPPSIGTNYKSNFITAVAKKDEQFIMILDMEKIFTTDEIIMLSDNNKATVTA